MNTVKQLDLVVPVAVQFWLFDQVAVDLARLADAVLSHEDPHQRETNVQAHMTAWNMLAHPEFAAIAAEAEAIVRDWYWVNAGRQVDTETTGCWGLAYSPGDWCRPHQHLPDSYSWVYYVSVPKGARLEFAGHTHECHAGQGIVFPSYVEHWVPTHTSEHMRICVAGNIRVS